MSVVYKPRRLSLAIVGFLSTVEWVPTVRIIEVCGTGLKTPRTSVRAALVRMRRGGLVDALRVPAPHPIQYVTQWRLVRSSRMTLEDAQALISSGVAFGDVYLRVAEADQMALKGWYCTNPNVPKREPKQVPVVAGAGYTGNPCKNCSSVRMIRAGSCETCLECGSSSGCG